MSLYIVQNCEKPMGVFDDLEKAKQAIITELKKQIHEMRRNDYSLDRFGSDINFQIDSIMVMLEKRYNVVQSKLNSTEIANKEFLFFELDYRLQPKNIKFIKG